MTNDKLTGLAVVLAILVGLFAPASAQATSNKTNSYKYTHHKAMHYYCPYAGCRKDFRKH
jgi:hypothetical protein